MDASTLQRRQDIMASQSLDSMLMVHTKPENEQQQEQEKKARPAEDALKCPRCDSTNTKFCYYNNYSLTQPRYFCKSCRRYWTKGGTLRNVPVGGGCRKNKRCSRRATPEHHLHSLISSPSISSSQDLLTPLTSYDHYNGNGNGIPVSGYSGNNNNHHFDLFGNQFNGNLLNSLYYGNNLGNLDNINNIGVNHDEELHHQMGMHFDLLHLQNHQEIMSNASSGASTPTPTIKQEFGDNNRALFMNYIMNNGGNAAEIDAPKESWNGVLASSWHNLINSPLM